MQKINGKIKVQTNNTLTIRQKDQYHINTWLNIGYNIPVFWI